MALLHPTPTKIFPKKSFEIIEESTSLLLKHQILTFVRSSNPITRSFLEKFDLIPNEKSIFTYTDCEIPILSEILILFSAKHPNFLDVVTSSGKEYVIEKWGLEDTFFIHEKNWKCNLFFL